MCLCAEFERVKTQKNVFIWVFLQLVLRTKTHKISFIWKLVVLDQDAIFFCWNFSQLDEWNDTGVQQKFVHVCNAPSILSFVTNFDFGDTKSHSTNHLAKWRLQFARTCHAGFLHGDFAPRPFKKRDFVQPLYFLRNFDLKHTVIKTSKNIIMFDLLLSATSCFIVLFCVCSIFWIHKCVRADSSCKYPAQEISDTCQHASWVVTRTQIPNEYSCDSSWQNYDIYNFQI